MKQHNSIFASRYFRKYQIDYVAIDYKGPELLASVSGRPDYHQISYTIYLCNSIKNYIQVFYILI